MILALILSISAAVSPSCTKKVPTAVDWVAGMLSLTPSQNGKALPISYTIPPSGDSIVCKVIFEQVSPGDTGMITWVLKNASSEGGDLSIKATLSSIPGDKGVSSSDINIKLKYGGVYSLGSSSTQSSLEGLVTFLNAQYRSQDSYQVLTYELEWQIAGNAMPAGIDKAGDTSQANSIVLEVAFQLVSWPGND
jgi:hypothetical protein